MLSYSQLEAVVEEANKYIKRKDEYTFYLYKNLRSYIDDFFYEVDEDEIENFEESIGLSIESDIPFIEFYQCGIESEYKTCESIDTHEDVFSAFYFEESHIHKHTWESSLVYVNEDDLETLKRLVQEHFDNGEFSKSPYSTSCYNSRNIGWNSKPDGSMRLADHWNFTTDNDEDEDKVHCKTDVYLDDDLAIARYCAKDNEYKVIFSTKNDYKKMLPVKITSEGIEFI